MSTGPDPRDGEALTESAETLTDAEVAALPLDERVYFALLDAGLDETDALAAQEAVLPMFAADLRELAGEVEWKHRSMTFYRGGGSDTRLHSSGQMIRAHADALAGAC